MVNDRLLGSTHLISSLTNLFCEFGWSVGRLYDATHLDINDFARRLHLRGIGWQRNVDVEVTEQSTRMVTEAKMKRK